MHEHEAHRHTRAWEPAPMNDDDERLIITVVHRDDR